MQNIKERINTATLNMYINAQAGARKTRQRLRDKTGSFFTDHALAIVIIVVIAAIFLMALVGLFKDRIFPQLESKTDEFFAIS